MTISQPQLPIKTVGSPIYLNVYNYFKQEIASGRLRHGDRLPSVRKLASMLNLSTTPIEQGYAQLTAEGFIESRPKSGYFVLAEQEPKLSMTHEQHRVSRKLPLRDPHTYAYDFHLSKNDFSLFPHAIWRKLMNRSLSESTAILEYGDPQGDPLLRQSIAEYLRLYRGVRCAAEQVVIGADPSVLLSYLGLIAANDRPVVGVENPSYPMIASMFRRLGSKVVRIPVDEAGICVNELAKHRIDIAAVAPSHHYPLGMLMPISRRYELLDWSERTGALIIEDDYDGELRYAGRPVPALQGLRPNANVAYIGGFSQLLSPAVCIHYMVLPTDWLDRYDRLQYDMLFEHTASPLLQDTLRRFMQEGYWERHVRKMRNHYKKKYAMLLDAVEERFGERAELLGTGAGFYVLLRLLDEPRSERELIDLARGAGVRVSTAAYTWEPPPVPQRKEFFLGFGGIETQRIEEGIEALYRAWHPVHNR